MSDIWRRIFNLAATVIGVIGLVSLPADLGTWGDRGNDVLDMASGNPLSAIAILLAVGMLLFANWSTIRGWVGKRKRWRNDEEMGAEMFGWFRDAGLEPIDIHERSPEDPPISFHYKVTTANKSLSVFRITGHPVSSCRSASVFQTSTFPSLLASVRASEMRC